ncbi:hypothetical protein LCGC14_1504720 [marine sediment metagenome]|uniref:Uncharacterized protein n=1 Tax=marine sediment metagenome TaxID=412755 RepID=A0A0F9LIE1_9ZZZZ
MTRAVAQSGFTMIPDVLAARMDLGSTAKWALSYMIRKAQNRTVKVGLRTLGLLGGKSFQQMSCAVQELERAGEIQITRGRLGQRWSYRLLKASAMPTVPQTKSVRHADGASAMPTEASAMPTRMRERPSESKKKPPKPPWKGGLDSSPSPQKTRTAEKSGKPVPQELHQAVLALFYPSGVLPRQQGRVEGLVNDLGALSATPREVRRRKKRWRAVYQDRPCTLRSLVARWDLVEAPPPIEGIWDPYGEDEP